MSKIGFCFSGEGARGSIQAGVALALSEKGIKPDFVIGVSSGAVCSAAYAYLGPQGLADMWSNINSLWDVFSLNWNCLWANGVFNQKPAEKILLTAIQNTPICEAVIARMNLYSSRIQYMSNKQISKEEFGEALLGAFAIPGLVNDRGGWVDAGFRVDAPLQQCIDSGCTEIYVILGSPLNISSYVPSGFLRPAVVAVHAVTTSIAQIMLNDITKFLKKNQEPGYINVILHLCEFKETYFDDLAFSECSSGVKIGMTEYMMRDELALKMRLGLN